MIESIELILSYVNDVSASDFSQDLMLQDAVQRRLEILGEAAKNIPEDIRSRYPDIRWRQISGLRDILTHSYHNVSIDRIWSIVQNDLKGLHQALSVIFSDLANETA